MFFENGNTYILGVSSHQDTADNPVEGMYVAMEFYTRVSDYHDWIIEEIDE